MRASIALAFCLLLSTVGARVQSLNEPGLLFYLSGDHGLSADYAGSVTVESRGAVPEITQRNNQVRVLSLPGR